MHADLLAARVSTTRSDDLLGTVEARMSCLAGTGQVSSGQASFGQVGSEATRAGDYHLATGGHRVRARLALQAGIALGLDDGDAVALACSAELLHNASLVHDDLQDRDETRRGRPTVWRAFSAATAICSGDLLLSSAYAALVGFADRTVLPALIALAHARVAVAIDGQCEDLRASCGNLERYEGIARRKSGALLSLPLEYALVGAGRWDVASVARDAADHFAVGYQIADDLADVSRDERRGALNVVPVLRASYGAMAERAARTLAVRHLDDAAAGAAALPDGSGTLLGMLATRLSATL